ncbi:hypothetical protein [Vibrio algicola]|nr:hypothetical protein [Vibrio algicola]
MGESLQLAIASKVPLSTTTSMPLRRLIRTYHKIREMTHGQTS